MSTFPTPPAPAPKKGMSGPAIAGIGCAGIIVVIVIAGFMLLGKACSKLQEVTGDIQKNPARAGVMIALKMNPDIEVLSTDDTKNEVTFKQKSTGKVTTMSFDDIKNGKFKITTDGQEVVVDGSSVAKEGKITMKDAKGNEVTINGGNNGGGVVHTKGPDGEMTLGGANAAPAWVPAYPGAKTVEGGMKMEKADETTGMAMSETSDAVSKVKDFYNTKLTEAGYKVETNAFTADNKETVMLNATKADGKSTITATISSEDGKTKLMLNYQSKK